MSVLPTIPNGASNKDVRDTLNSMLARLLALEESGTGTPTPAPTPTPSPSQPYDIYLLAGQSNMQGRVVPDGSETDQAGLFQFPSYPGAAAYRTISPDTTPLIHHYNEYYSGPGEPFGKLQSAGGRQVLLVPCAAAGSHLATGAGHWQAGSPGGSLYEATIAQANAAIAAAKAVNAGSALKGIFWAQGESDGTDPGGSGGGASYAAYRAALAALIAGWRTRIMGAAGVPFVIGGMVPEFVASDPINKGIARAQAQSMALDDVFYFIGPTGQSGDSLHYLRPALSLLAASYVAAPTVATNFLRFTMRANMGETIFKRGYGNPTATARTAARLPSGQDGFFAATLPEAPGASGPILGMGAGNPAVFGDLELGIFADTGLSGGGAAYNGSWYGVLDHGSVVPAGNLTSRVVMQAGDVVRFRRSGGVGLIEVSQDGLNSWTTAYSAAVSTAALAPFLQCGSNDANGVVQQPYGSANIV